MENAAETRIHPTAVVDAAAELDSGVIVGPYAVIDGDVRIGAGSSIGTHAHIATGSRLGRNVHVYDGAAVGNPPQDLKFAGERTELFIGEGTVIRECATLNRGTVATGRTLVGAECLIMAYAHVAHDNELGDHVILANAVQLAGHIQIGDWAIIGGGTVVHQFCRIGPHAMVGGGYRVPQDIVPFVTCGGYPLKTVAVNRIGMARRGFTSEQIGAIDKAFRILFRSGLNTSQAIEKLKSEGPHTPETALMIQYASGSERGITR